MQHAPPPNDGRYPPSGRPESVYSSPAYGPPATAYTQYTQNISAQSEPRTDTSGQFRGTLTAVETPTESSSSTSPANRRTRKRKSPPTQSNNTASSSLSGQYEFETSAQGAAEHPHHQQQQSTSQFALDPGMQTFVSTDGGDDDHGEDHSGSQGRSPASSRPVNPSKRAEQNRKAQRAFRERRDAHVKELEHRSTLFDQAMADLADTNRRFDECRHMVDALRSENQRLSAENQRLSAALAAAGGGGTGSVFPPPHHPQPLDPSLTATVPPTTSSTAPAPAPTEPVVNTTVSAHAEEIAVENMVDDGAEEHESDETAGEELRQPKRAKR